MSGACRSAERDAEATLPAADVLGSKSTYSASRPRRAAVIRPSFYNRSTWLYASRAVYTPAMSKHLVDLDEEALGAARAELGTATIKDTVNEALRRASEQRRPRVAAALDTLAAAALDDRADAWR